MVAPLEKRKFPEAIDGQRFTLVQPNTHHTRQVWECIQRDHSKGGNLYSWIESIEDVAKYITTEPSDNFEEITYLLLKNDLVIGTFHIHTMSYSNYKAEVGYSLEKGKEGNGYISEAMVLVESQMKSLGFNKLIICCSINNKRSIKVAERAGFSHEGTLLEDRIEDGKFTHSLVFGKLLG